MPEPDLTLTEVAVTMKDLGSSLRIAGDFNSGRNERLITGGGALDSSSSSSEDEHLTMAQGDDIGLETTLRIARLKPQLEKWRKKAAARRVKNRRLKLELKVLREQMSNKDEAPTTSPIQKGKIDMRKSVEEATAVQREAYNAHLEHDGESTQRLQVDDDKEILSRALARLSDDDTKFPFEPVPKLQKKYPGVMMFSRTDATGMTWCKSYGDIDASMDDVFGYIWDFCSDERMAQHREDNGSLVRKLETCNVGRCQIAIAEYKVAPGVHNRWDRGKISWFKLENGWQGKEAILISGESAEVVKGRDYGVTEGAILCLNQASYLLEKIGVDVTRLTMIRSVNIGGNIPQWVVKYAILPNFLVWVGEIQIRFKRLKSTPSLATRAVQEHEERHSFSNLVSARLREIEESLEIEDKTDENEMQLMTIRKMMTDSPE